MFSRNQPQTGTGTDHVLRGGLKSALAIFPLFAFYNLLLLVTGGFTVRLVDPLANAIIPLQVMISSIVCFAFVTKLLVAYAEGFRGAILLLPGAMLLDAWYFSPNGLSLGRLVTIFIVLAIPPFSFKIMHWATMMPQKVDFSRPESCRIVYLVGFMAAFLCSVAILGMKGELGSVPVIHGLAGLLVTVLGHMLALAAVLFSISRGIRLFSR